MSMIFNFRVLSGENDDFRRDYQVLYDMDLSSFHDFICADLGFDRNLPASFFTAAKDWAKEREFTLIDMGIDDPEAPVPMKDITLGQIIHQNHDRLIYTFDLFADRSLYLELTRAFEAETDVAYPRVAGYSGNAPLQLDAEAIDTEPSIFDEALGEFSDFEGDDLYDDEF